MSWYNYEKVLRIPMEKINMESLIAKAKEKDENFVYDEFEFFNDLQFVFPDIFDYGEPGKFQRAPTESDFIDYVLEFEYDVEGEYGKVRELFESEKAKYLPLFQQIDENVNMDDVHLVEFCWYNSTEAPDYYDIKSDSFYNEI